MAARWALSADDGLRGIPRMPRDHELNGCVISLGQGK